MATALESRGLDLNDPLWSARVLLDDPESIAAVHTDFLRAGADCIATASYQATVEGFERRGLERDEAMALIARSVELAAGARDQFWSRPENRVGRLRPLVAASVGPYGAFLADGSEYSGAYGRTEGELYAFHKERWHHLASGAVDVMACETIPSRPEVRALLRLIAETAAVPAWISLSCADAEHLADGSAIDDVAALCDQEPGVVAVGVNCVSPLIVADLIRCMRRSTAKPILVYPNSGERYRSSDRTWTESPEPLDWAQAVQAWAACGASGVGGCCRVGPETIRQVRTALVG